MTASVSIVEGNGASVSWTSVTVGRYCTTDAADPGNSYPLVIPSSGFYFSYWKHHRMAFSGTYTQLSNFRFYTGGTIKTDWSLGTGGMIIVGRRDSSPHGCPAGSYSQATGTQGQFGNYLKDADVGHPYYKGQTIDPIDADSCTSGSPLVFDNSVYGPNATGATFSVVHQAKVADDATQGAKGNQLYTVKYDEI